MEPARTIRRRYGGKSADQRRAERRATLERAGLDIWQEQGWAAVTMRGVCARAGLTDRYFYENYTDRDALLATLWDRMRDESVAAVLAALRPAVADPPFDQLRIALGALLTHLAEDAARAQILFGDHCGSAILELRRRETIQQATDIVIRLAKPHLRGNIDETAFRVNVLVGIGGFVELMYAWRSDLIATTTPRLVDHLMDLAEALAPRFLEDGSKARPNRRPARHGT